MTARSFVGTRSDVLWHSLFDEPIRPDGHERVLADWIGDYLTRPHEDLGRGGPICPYVRPAITHRSMVAAFVPGAAELTEDRMRSIVLDAFDIHAELVAATPDRRGPQVVITVFPELADVGRVDSVHAAHKDLFVGNGLMLGQFYPGCGQPGLWNSDFRPLDAPLPMLVVREMMNTDYPFLVGDPDWVYAYLTKFARGLPAKLRRTMAERSHLTDGPSAVAITDHRAHDVGEFAGSA
ncbi:hypothetical protein KO481_03805 [Nocardia sp. NEAU-G5]|uniref:DUF6875 domain-containing protein n=1 Tax=Nocardia albiluteola TaxID=2842303 RepID=A0ABS6AST1_9NOCA|nr:hypothetical protein [Nocardia albiluteola]MBU3060645.1 hypothetical protein [Nocardia albiluteola]